MIRLDSSVIESVGYNHVSQGLIVKFKSGREYLYSNVPFRLYEDFINAQSSGRYFNSYIKEAFPVRELET